MLVSRSFGMFGNTWTQLELVGWSRLQSLRRGRLLDRLLFYLGSDGGPRVLVTQRLACCLWSANEVEKTSVPT